MASDYDEGINELSFEAADSKEWQDSGGKTVWQKKEMSDRKGRVLWVVR